MIFYKPDFPSKDDGPNPQDYLFVFRRVHRDVHPMLSHNSSIHRMSAHAAADERWHVCLSQETLETACSRAWCVNLTSARPYCHTFPSPGLLPPQISSAVVERRMTPQTGKSLFMYLAFFCWTRLSYRFNMLRGGRERVSEGGMRNLCNETERLPK